MPDKKKRSEPEAIELTEEELMDVQGADLSYGGSADDVIYGATPSDPSIAPIAPTALTKRDRTAKRKLSRT